MVFCLLFRAYSGSAILAGLYRVPDIDAAIELVNGTEFGSSPSLSRRSGCRTAATLTRDAGRAEPEYRPAGSPAQPPRDEDLPAQAEHGRPAHRLRQAFSPASLRFNLSYA